VQEVRTIPLTVRISALEACRDELARRAERERRRARQRGGGSVDASLGREIDAIESRLAQARKELARIRTNPG
jgi:hypothetical protein